MDGEFSDAVSDVPESLALGKRREWLWFRGPGVAWEVPQPLNISHLPGRMEVCHSCCCEGP